MKRRKKPESLLVDPKELDTKTEIKPNINDNEIDVSDKYRIKSGKVRIDFESEGKFSLPESLWFEDYDVEDINDIVLAKEDEILETLIAILNKYVEASDGEKVDVGDSLIEEFFEILIGMKIAFNTYKHQHKWICRCQKDVPDEQKKASTFEIDLTTIQYRSISEVEKDLKEYMKSEFERMSDEAFKNYLSNRYEEEVSYTREEEVENIKVMDSIIVPLGENVYKFRFTRIRDLAEGYKIAAKEFDGQIRKIEQKYRFTGSDNEEAIENKKQALDKVNQEKAKKAIIYSQALSLISENGVEIKTAEEKINIFRKMKRFGFINLSSFLERIKFGVQDERDFVCDLCRTTVRGYLQRRFNPLELLPLDESQQHVTRGELQSNTGPNVYFGV